MSESVDRLAPADRDELVAFLGRAFAKDVPDWFARNLRITVDGEGARCEPTADPAVFAADPRAMLQTLCGPLPPSLRAPLPPAAAILDTWCPLPLYFSRQDRV